MTDDFSLCMVSNTRKAARAITRRYDAYARRLGITATQFSLLGHIQSRGERTVTDLADEGGFERTTLTRNLDRLEAMGLITSRSAPRGNGRICALTATGRERFADMLPEWRKAQAELRAVLGESDFLRAVETLRQLSAL